VQVPGTASSADAQALQTLRECGALLEGHFLLSSGRHAARYIQCARLLQHPRRAEAVCALLAERIRSAEDGPSPVSVVVGPALGAVTLAYEMARALGARALFAERALEGGFALRRGFAIQPGEPVLVVEDVVTTGKSVGEVLQLLRKLETPAAAVAALVNRSGGPDPFGGLPFFRLLDLEIPSFEPGDCPLCREGAPPPVKPGSRPGAA